MQPKAVCLIILLSVIWLLCLEEIASNPQLNELNSGCSQYNVTNFKDFSSNLNASFIELRQKLNSNLHFATAQQARASEPAYTMVQCRNYLSSADCLACFEAALVQIRNCSANGARVIYDGCFLRFESNNFYDQSTQEGHSMICGNETSSNAGAFQAAVQGLLTDLQVATPGINRYYAAIKKEVVGGGSGNSAVYGVAQCIETISESGCQECMQVVTTDIQRCPPNTEGRAVDVGCFLRYSATPFFADNQTTDITPFLKTGSSSKKKAIIGGVVGGASLLLIVIALLVWFKLSKRQKGTNRGDILGATELQGPSIYKYKDLVTATNNFSEENKLGEGGFGDVYKGVLKNGKIVAIKKLVILQSRRAKLDFESEVKLISNVHHRNLVRLLGCSSKGLDQLILVYEYMANSSLDKFLFGERRGSLNWKQRYDIIVGTARGLAYLHEEFHVCIIHRDIKSSNILLDDYFQPKIADFGLVRLLPEDKSHLSTKFAGTLGYTSPEYAIHGQLSEKTDVYSYGIVVLEIISGQKSHQTDPDSEFLLKRAWTLYENNMHIELVDESLDPNEYEAEEAKRIIEIALMCTQSTAALRPTMTEVIVLLKSKGKFGRTPLTKPIFVDSDYKRVGQDTSTSSASAASVASMSNATASTTQVSGR